MNLVFQDWGLIDYEEALQKQIELVEKTHAEDSPGYLIFCTHPAVVTLGRATQPGDVFAWPGKIVEISRGGRATYHGPSQLVVYPILNLTQARQGRPQREIAGYLRALENGIVAALKFYNVDSMGKSLQKKSDDSTTDETGVWIGSRKIASLGIGVKKWITYHGAAINLSRDPRAFQGMIPCGFSAATMISLEEVLDRPVETSEFKKILREELERGL